MNAKEYLRNKPEADIVKATATCRSAEASEVCAQMLEGTYDVAAETLLQCGWKPGPAEDFVVALDSLMATACERAHLEPLPYPRYPRRAPAQKQVTSADFFDCVGRQVFNTDDAELRRDVVAKASNFTRFWLRHPDELRRSKHALSVLNGVSMSLQWMAKVSERLMRRPAGWGFNEPSSGFSLNKDAAARHFSLF